MQGPFNVVMRFKDEPHIIEHRRGHWVLLGVKDRTAWSLRHAKRLLREVSHDRRHTDFYDRFAIISECEPMPRPHEEARHEADR